MQTRRQGTEPRGSRPIWRRGRSDSRCAVGHSSVGGYAGGERGRRGRRRTRKAPVTRELSERAVADGATVGGSRDNDVGPIGSDDCAMDGGGGRRDVGPDGDDESMKISCGGRRDVGSLGDEDGTTNGGIGGQDESLFVSGEHQRKLCSARELGRESFKYHLSASIPEKFGALTDEDRNVAFGGRRFKRWTKCRAVLSVSAAIRKRSAPSMRGRRKRATKCTLQKVLAN